MAESGAVSLMREVRLDAERELRNASSNHATALKTVIFWADQATKLRREIAEYDAAIEVLTNG